MSAPDKRQATKDARVTVDRRVGLWTYWLRALFSRRRGERRDGLERRRRVVMERKDEV